jgi:hypothetical protein
MAACGRRSDLVPDELARQQFLAPPLLHQGGVSSAPRTLQERRKGDR